MSQRPGNKKRPVGRRGVIAAITGGAIAALVRGAGRATDEAHDSDSESALPRWVGHSTGDSRGPRGR